ncbi:MAG: hypothetical protein F6K42_16180 [Leptolyngbya sp. SIO1D8]|nr:hypothetical protein [Leptolyngbya sp. SIO1D8]
MTLRVKMLMTLPGCGPGSKGLQFPGSAKPRTCRVWMVLMTLWRGPMRRMRSDRVPQDVAAALLLWATVHHVGWSGNSEMLELA